MARQFIFVTIYILCAAAAHAQATFKGGADGLEKFLKEHIVYPEYSRKNCLEGLVQVRFRVAADGKVSEVSVYKGPGLDLDDEAKRVVRMTSGKWTLPAGMQAALMVLPVRFTPDYSRCTTANTVNRDDAIEAYRNRQELENVVTNYYKNKYLGKADTTKESYIEALKKQLEFDDELIDQVLKQAAAKWKQGDNEGACEDWKFIRNIGSSRADEWLAKYCK